MSRTNGFDAFHDAVHEAHFRAAITRRRYRVRKTTGTLWWITELTARLATPAPEADQ